MYRVRLRVARRRARSGRGPSQCGSAGSCRITFWKSRYAAGARLIAVPGWPLPTFCTASSGQDPGGVDGALRRGRSTRSLLGQRLVLTGRRPLRLDGRRRHGWHDALWRPRVEPPVADVGPTTCTSLIAVTGRPVRRHGVAGPRAGARGAAVDSDADRAPLRTPRLAEDAVTARRRRRPPRSSACRPTAAASDSRGTRRGLRRADQAAHHRAAAGHDGAGDVPRRARRPVRCGWSSRPCVGGTLSRRRGQRAQLLLSTATSTQLMHRTSAARWSPARSSPPRRAWSSASVLGVRLDAAGSGCWSTGCRRPCRSARSSSTSSVYTMLLKRRTAAEHRLGRRRRAACRC